MLTRRRLLEAAALIGAAPTVGSALTAAVTPFRHGVASGDPGHDRVILWTRVSGADAPVEVALDVAERPDFSGNVRRSSIVTDASRDYTVKVDRTDLEPGRVYHYRFRVGDHTSPIGRTRTLPRDDATIVRLGIVSCSNYPAGYFNVYRALGHRHDLDAILHLGDYIYEYPYDGYASERAAEFGRLSNPRGELLTVDDYRLRHAQYKSDPDLQYVHRRVPFIVSWDDHEIANNAWRRGAQNHDPGEGDYADRVAAALTAYYEWMPIREPNGDPREAYRAFDFGRIATLAMLETRLSGRSEAASLRNDMPPMRSWFDAERPREAIDPGPSGDTSGLVAVPAVYDLRGEKPVAVNDYRRLERLNAAAELPEGYGRLPDIERFRTEVLADPERRMIDDRQRRWLGDVLTASARRGQAHRVLGNQTLMSPLVAADLTTMFKGERLAALPSYLRERIPWTRYGLPGDVDNWSGYPADRERVLELMHDAGGAIVVTGDTHNAWSAPLRDARGRRCGYELATSSVTSPGPGDSLGLTPAEAESLVRRHNPHFEFLDFAHRGAVVMELTAESSRADYLFVNRIDLPRFHTLEPQTVDFDATAAS